MTTFSEMQWQTVLSYGPLLDDDMKPLDDESAKKSIAPRYKAINGKDPTDLTVDYILTQISPVIIAAKLLDLTKDKFPKIDIEFLSKVGPVTPKIIDKDKAKEPEKPKETPPKTTEEIIKLTEPKPKEPETISTKPKDTKPKDSPKIQEKPKKATAKQIEKLTDYHTRILDHATVPGTISVLKDYSSNIPVDLMNSYETEHKFETEMVNHQFSDDNTYGTLYTVCFPTAKGLTKYYFYTTKEGVIQGTFVSNYRGIVGHTILYPDGKKWTSEEFYNQVLVGTSGIKPGDTLAGKFRVVLDDKIDDVHRFVVCLGEVFGNNADVYYIDFDCVTVPGFQPQMGIGYCGKTVAQVVDASMAPVVDIVVEEPKTPEPAKTVKIQYYVDEDNEWKDKVLKIPAKAGHLIGSEENVNFIYQVTEPMMDPKNDLPKILKGFTKGENTFIKPVPLDFNLFASEVYVLSPGAIARTGKAPPAEVNTERVKQMNELRQAYKMGETIDLNKDAMKLTDKQVIGLPY